MSPEAFNDSRLDDEEALAHADASLRQLAEAGARVRREAEAAKGTECGLIGQGRPRAVVAAGADARLLRAVLEPWCPVPFVAWPGPGLPGWVGALDLVVVLAPAGGDAETASAVHDAVRRGSAVMLACPSGSPLAEAGQGRHTTLVPAQTGDPLAVAVVVLQLLHALELGPEVSAESVALALDDVASRCSPYADLAANPAKDLALVLADALPLVWGGSVLSARAGRRVAETLRRASNRPALAADADHLLPVLEGSAPRDVFEDPFADLEAPTLRPSLFILDDGAEQPVIREARGRLLATAEASGVRTRTLRWAEGPEVARYAALQSLGTYAAVYLAVGLGRYMPPA
ncbi:SIS domain-containing protein [Actinopolymorpha alba]|uniref:SIS domain-containing protein n=1 Tax=Actinopolymorpha alba TaxID=533267 RepID=UPI000361553D|nr:SIS domain-containing protein [Actinopolymorpha alba]